MRWMRTFLLLTLTTILLSGCAENESTTPTTNSKLESLAQPTPTCTSQDFQGGSTWITGQLEAFKKSEPAEAYSYASEEFRKANSLQDFAAIIVSQYSMLLDIKEFQILSCEKNGELFTFVLKMVDNQSNSYSMEYLLTFSNKKWGVEGASVTLKVSS